jgi:hypothetical protein
MDTKPAPNWWARNWRWLLPAGCLTGVVGVAGFIALIFSLLFGLIKSSTPYQQALAIPLQGPRGSGTLYVEARQSAGTWTYSTLTVQPNGAGGPISLLRPSL